MSCVRFQGIVDKSLSAKYVYKSGGRGAKMQTMEIWKLNKDIGMLTQVRYLVKWNTGILIYILRNM